jgi:GNAT superfamily N-acetyltransferase
MWFSPILLACEDTLGCEDHKYLDRKPRATWRIGGLETRPAGCSPLWQAGWATTLAEQMGHQLEQGRDSELPYDTATRQVVGFVTAMGDGALGAFIPRLEALPECRGRGIGAELMRPGAGAPGRSLLDRSRVRPGPRALLRTPARSPGHGHDVRNRDALTEGRRR